MASRRVSYLVVLVAGFLVSGAATAADPRSASMLSNTCAGCHGTNGASAGDAMPTIGGLNKRYIFKAMKDFQGDARESTIMGRMARGYSDLELQAIASFFAEQPWVPTKAPIKKSLVSQGEKVHKEQCESCHKDNGRYNSKETPRLAGQWPVYLYNQLRDLHDFGSQGMQPTEMRQRVQKLNEEEIMALSQFYASQK